jgi:circadian clock protein KaiC
MAVAQRLLLLTRSLGITLLATSVIDTPDPSVEATRIQISTVADTWIHVSYAVQGGERNRALTIIKSRGTKHSNQVRELSDEGVALADVSVIGGEVLMGTLRFERETEAKRSKEAARLVLDIKRRKQELAEVELQARSDLLVRELELGRAELAALSAEEESTERGWKDDANDLHRLRSTDGENFPGKPA